MEEIDLKQIDLNTLKPLVMAEVPEVEDFFDITVTLAASPSNFTVSFLNSNFKSMSSEANTFLIIIFGGLGNST